MKKLFILIPILLLAALALTGCGQSAESLNNEGNEAFDEQNYEGAMTAYLQAQEDAPEVAEPHYNTANTHYRLADYEQAQQEIEHALVGEERQGDLDQNSYYNLGNVFFQGEQYEAAIEAYKEALRLNPDDLQAKNNLELALRQLQQQEQEQQQEQQDQENEDQQDQENQDQQDQENQDQQDQENQDQQDQENQDQQDQENQDQQDQENQDQQDQQNQDQQDQPQEGQADGQPQEIIGLSEEQARQMFEAAAEGTESLEEYLQQILVFPGAAPTEDW